MDKLLLIDGNSIINRAFYGIGGGLLTNAEGLYTGAIYGFVNILLRTIEKEKPTHVCVAFDKGRHTFRHDMYPEYKGQRKGMPEELRVQMPVLKEVLDAMRVARAELEEIEADDLIGTLSKAAEEAGMTVAVLTGDRDSFQLVDSRVTVIMPSSSNGSTKVERVTPETVRRWFYSIGPDRVVDMKALMGDSSDNIPGCPGVGPRTASSLLEDFDSLEGIYEHLDEVKNESLRIRLAENRELCFLCYRLAAIRRDVPLEQFVEGGTLDALKVREPDYLLLLKKFRYLEFRKLIQSMNLEEKAAEQCHSEIPDEDEDNEWSLFGPWSGAGSGEKNASAEATLIAPEKRPEIETVPVEEDVFPEYPDGTDSLYFITEYEKEVPCRVRMYAGGNREYLFRFGTPEEKALFVRKLGEKLEDENVAAYFFDAKPIVTACLRNGVRVRRIANDLTLCGYLADSTRKLDDYVSAVRFFTGKERPEITFMPEVCRAAYRKVCDLGMQLLLDGMELPLVTVLAKMECCGFSVDAEVLRREGAKYGENLERLKERIFTLCGKEFNINSPKQLGDVLFEDLKLPGGKKSKTGYKTGQEVLEELVDLHPAVPLILEYRQNAKLKSTYIEGLLNVIDPETGRVYSTFNQTVTATGRLSSSEPNLQNIPVRHELGRVIRSAFVASDRDHVLIDADYSQIELRLMAALSGDENMMAAFRDGVDIHALTAAEVGGVELSEVTPEMRSRAKAVNFGIIYGMSEYGLAKEIDVSVPEARRYIAGYFRKFPGVRGYLESLKAAAKRTGYAVTPLGRRRYLPELISPKHPIRQFGERVAMNMPIQGAAADIIKLAMVKVDRELEAGGFRARLILQVHDELLLDAPVEEAEQVKELLVRCMENVVDLGVPPAGFHVGGLRMEQIR